MKDGATVYFVVGNFSIDVGTYYTKLARRE